MLPVLPTVKMWSSDPDTRSVQYAICFPSGETANPWVAMDARPSFFDSFRMAACGGPSPPVTRKPKSSLKIASLGVGVTFGFAVGLGGTMFGTLVMPGVGDALGLATAALRSRSWNPTMSAIASTATIAPAVKR